MRSRLARRARVLVTVAAWAVLAGIVFATLSPLDLRPESGLPSVYERFGAFALMGVLFALAYPRRLGLLIAMLLGVAVGLEALQVIAQNRHPRIDDAEVKLAGALFGLVGGWLVNRLVAHLQRQRCQPPLAGGSSSSHRS
jgi:membrane associated rhomboid family serine protease